MRTVALLVFALLAEFCRLFSLFAVMMLLVISTLFLVLLLLAIFLVVFFLGVLLVVMPLLGLLVLVPNLVALQTINRSSATANETNKVRRERARCLNNLLCRPFLPRARDVLPRVPNLRLPQNGDLLLSSPRACARVPESRRARDHALPLCRHPDFHHLV